MDEFRALIFELLADASIVAANEPDRSLIPRVAELQARLSKLLASAHAPSSPLRQSVAVLPAITIAKRVLAASEAGMSLDDLTSAVAAKKADSDPAAIKRNLSVQLSRSPDFINEDGKWKWVDNVEGGEDV